MSAPAAHRRPGPLAVMLLAVLGVLFILVPFLFWWQTWFGRRLSDRDLDSYFRDFRQGRRIQHALVQVSERMAAGDPAAPRWRPDVLRASAHPDPLVRSTAAWTMGQDLSSPAMHEGLRLLLGDSDLQVRRNAALSLVRFGDRSGNAELSAILRPLQVRTARGGVAKLLVAAGQDVGAGTRVATVVLDGGGEEHAAAPFHAKVAAVLAADGARVAPGAPLAALAPREDDVWEALRGLYYIGGPGDLPEIERYAHGSQGMPDRVARQAELTARAIRTRSEPSSNR